VESTVESVALSWLASLFGPAEPAALYLGPLPKVISCEIMINIAKNPSETKT
jgi:hypothetical protein